MAAAPAAAAAPTAEAEAPRLAPKPPVARAATPPPPPAAEVLSPPPVQQAPRAPAEDAGEGPARKRRKVSRAGDKRTKNMSALMNKWAAVRAEQLQDEDEDDADEEPGAAPDVAMQTDDNANLESLGMTWEEKLRQLRARQEGKPE